MTSGSCFSIDTVDSGAFYLIRHHMRWALSCSLNCSVGFVLLES